MSSVKSTAFSRVVAPRFLRMVFDHDGKPTEPANGALVLTARADSQGRCQSFAVGQVTRRGIKEVGRIGRVNGKTTMKAPAANLAKAVVEAVARAGAALHFLVEAIVMRDLNKPISAITSHVRSVTVHNGRQLCARSVSTTGPSHRSPTALASIKAVLQAQRSSVAALQPA